MASDRADRQLSNGKYSKALHFDGKAKLAQEAIKKLGEDRVALVMPGGYYENARRVPRFR